MTDWMLNQIWEINGFDDEEDPGMSEIHYGCPTCKSGESLAFSEELTGQAHFDAVQNKNGTFEIKYGGYTDVDWDNAKTVGVECTECGWENTTYRDQTELATILVVIENGDGRRHE